MPICLSKDKNVIESFFELHDRINSFIPHGYYVVSNNTSYLIELSNCCSSARIKIDDNQVTEWFEIEYVSENCEFTDTNCYSGICHCEMLPVIDKEGYMIPLNQVVRLN